MAQFTTVSLQYLVGVMPLISVESELSKTRIMKGGGCWSGTESGPRNQRPSGKKQRERMYQG